MNTLTATLEAEQKKPHRTPYHLAYATDQPCEIPRWTWSQIYTSTDPDRWSAIAVTALGIIVRARSTAAGGLFVQRITNPATAAQWSSWTRLEADGTLHPNVQIALVCQTNSELVRLYYIDTTQKIAYNRESTDAASTWAAAEVIFNEATAGYTIQAITGSSRGGGNFCYYALNKGAPSPDTWLVAIVKTAGVWGGRHEHTQARHTVRALSSDRDSASISYLAVSDGSPARLSFQEYDELATSWLGGTVLTDVSAGATFTYDDVQFIESSSAYPRHLYAYVETFSAALTYQRTILAATPQRYFLTETVPVLASSTYGYKLLLTGGVWYLANSVKAYSSTAYNAATAGHKVDLSDDLLRFETRQTAPHQPMRATALLQNSDNAYTSIGAGSLLALREGSQLSVKLGYVTSAGNEAIWQEPLWIDRLTFIDDDLGQGHLELELIDAWDILDRLRVKRQLTFTAQTITYILNRVIWRICSTSLSPVNLTSQTLPSYTWQPGQTFADIARDLCRKGGVHLRFRTAQAAADGAGTSSVVAEIIAAGSGASSYSYGGTGQHPVTSSRHATGGQEIGHAEVYGAGTYYSWSLDLPYLGRVWRHIARKVTDKQLDSQAEIDNRATQELLDAQTTFPAGHLDSPANVAQQIADVVALTNARAGLSSAKRRVAARHLLYERHKKLRMDQRLWLTPSS